MSDEYNFDDFEDFDSEQKETAKAHGKSAKSYARNVLKSAKYIGLDVIKNFDPDIRDFLSDTSNIFTDMYDVVENAKKTVKDTIDKIFGSDSSTLETVKQIAKNTFDDLRTGQFYNQERQDAIFNDMFGGDMSFGWDDDSKDSDDSDSKKESKDISNTEMTNRISSSQQLSGMNTASMIIANDNKNTKISMSANMQMFNATNQTLLGINTSLVNIQQGLVNPLQNHIQNFNKFATVATEQLAKQTKYLSILASQIQKKNNDKQSFGENKELNSYSDIFGFGALPNLYNWANHVKEKIKQESSTITSMAEFLSPEMIKIFVSSFASSPIATLLSMATSGALKATFVGKEVEKTKRIVKNSILQAAFGIHEERLKGSDGMIGYLARLLDIIPNTNYKTSFSKYNKSASEWTGKDQKALRDVIPTQLSTIISILSGTEAKIFDYDRGRWYTATNYQKVFQKDKASQVMSDTEIRNLKDEIIKDIIIERNEELIKTKGNDAVAETSSGKFARTLQQDFDTLINLLALRNIEITAFSTKEEFLKVIDKYNWANDPKNKLISKESVRRIANIVFADPSTTVRFKDGIIRGKIARAKYIDRLSSSNNSILNIINNSGITDAHKLGSNRFGSDILIKTVDENKHNIFYYLSEILNNIKNISVSTGPSRTIHGVSKPILERKISQANKTTNTNQNAAQQSTKNVDDYNRRKLDPNSKYYDPDYASEIAVMRDRYIDLGDDLGYGQIVEKTNEEDGTVIFKQVDTSSNYTKAAEYVDRLKRDRAVSKGTIDYIEDYDKKRTKGLIQTVLEDFNEKLESLAYGDMSKALREKYKDAHGFTGVMERTGQIVKEQFQKLSDYFKGLWEKFKVSEWGENFFGTLKKKGKNLGSSIWDYIKERTFDIIEGITGTRPGSGKQEDFSGVNNEKNDKKRAANPSQAATGGVVKKSGMASVSEGEIIIPANKNPYYEDKLSLAQRQRIENKNYMAWVDDGAPGGPYFGNFAEGTSENDTNNLHLDNTGIQRITLNNILKYNLQTLLKLSNLLPLVNRLNDRELYKNIFTNFSSEDQDILRRTMQASDFDKLIDSNKSNTRLLDISDKYNKLLANEQKIQLRFPFRRKLDKLLYRWVKNIKELPDDTVTRLVDLLKPELDLRAVYENKPLDQISKKDIDDVGKSLQKLYKNNALRQAKYDLEIAPGSDVDFINRMEDGTLKSVTQSIQNNQPSTEKQNEILKSVTQSIQNNQPSTEKQNEILKSVTQSIQNNQPSTMVSLGDISTRILKKYGPTILTLLATGGLGYGAYHFSPQILDYGSQILDYLRQPGISSLTTGLISGIYSGLKSKRWSTGLLSGALGGLVPAVIDGLNPLQNINPEILNQVSTGAIDLAKLLSYLGVNSGLTMGAVTASSKFNPVEKTKNLMEWTKKKYGFSSPAYATVKELKDLGYDSSNPEKLIDTISKYDYNKLHAEGVAQQIIKDHKDDEWLYKRSGRWFGNDNERIIAKRIIYRLNTGDSINTLVSENDTSLLNYIKDKSKKIRKTNPKATDEEIIENISKNIKAYSRDFDKMHNGDFHVSNEAAILFKILFSEDIYIARAQEKQNELLKEIEGKKKSLDRKKLAIFNKSISAIKQDFDPRYNITPYIQNEALKYLSGNENIDAKELTNFMKNSFDGRANIRRLIETNIDKNILESHDIKEIFKYLNDNRDDDKLSFLYNIFDISQKDPMILKKFIKDKYYSKYKDQNIDFKHLILGMYNDYRPDMLSPKEYLSNKYNVKDKYGRIVLGSSSIYDNDSQMSFKEYQRLIQQAKNDKKMQNAIKNSFYKYNMDREEIWNSLQRLRDRNWESLSETDKNSSVLNRFDPIRTIANTFDKLFGTIANQNVDLKKLTVSTLDTFKKDYAWITGSSLIGGVIGALATGSPLGVLGGLVIGGGLEVVDRSKQWTDILYGKKNEKTGRYTGGFLSPKIATFMKEKMPNMAKAGAIGGGIGMLFGGPLGVLGGITLGSGLEYLRASTDFKEYFFGKDEISGKSKWDKTYEFIKRHNFGLKGATLGGTIGMYMGGPVGLLGGSLIGAATEYISGATGLTNALLGVKDIHGHRQGGLIGTLNYMFGSIPEKILNQLSVIPNTFKDMSVNIGKLAYQAIARPVGNYFKDLGKWVYRGIVGAVKNKIARISQTWLGKLFNPIANASRKLFGFIYDYSIGGLLNLPTKLMDWAKSGAEKAEKSLKLTHDVTDFLAGKYKGEMTPELLQRLQEHYSTMDQNKLKSDQSYDIYRLFDNNEKNENRFTNQSDEDIQKTLELGKSYINNLDAIHKQERDRGNLFRLIESTIKSNNSKYSIEEGNDTNAFWNSDRETLEQIFRDLGDKGKFSDFDEKLESFLTKQGVPLEDIDIIKAKAKELIDSKIDFDKYDESLLGKSEKNKNLFNWIRRNGQQIFNLDKNGNFIINERKYGQMKDRYNSMVAMMMAGREKRLEEIENEGNETVENASHNSYDQAGIVWDTMKDWMDTNLKGISTEISAIRKFFTGTTGDSKEVFTPKESAAVKLLSEAIKIAYDNIQKEKQGLNVGVNNVEEKESNSQSAEQPTQTNTQSKQFKINNIELIEGSDTAEDIKHTTIFGLGSGIGGDSSINTRIPRDISASVNTTPQGTTVNITNVIPPQTVTAPAPSQTNQTQNTNISNNTSGVTKVEFFEGQPIQYVRTNNGDWTYNLQDKQTRETVAYIRRRNQAFENLANGNITINNGNGQNGENNSTTGESNNTEGSVGKSILSQLVGGFSLFSKLITPITIGSTVFLPWIAKQFAGGSYDPGMYKGADPGERAKQLEKQNIFEKMSSGVRTIDNVILGKDMTTYREGDYVSEGIFSNHSENKSEDLISNKYTNKIVRNFFDPRTGKYMPMIEKLSNIKYVGNIFKPLKWAGQAGQYIREGKLGELWKNAKKTISSKNDILRQIGRPELEFRAAEKKLVKLKRIEAKATGLRKTSLFINKIAQSIEVGLKKIIYNLSKYKGLARLKIRAKTMDFGKWVKKLLAPISEHTLIKTVKNIGGKALHVLFHTPVLNWIFVGGAVADCLLNGSFRTRVVLGILTQPTLGEKVLAAILHGFNEWIPWIGGLIPTKYYVDWGMKLLQFLLGWTFGDLGKKRRAAEKEVDQYNKDNGTTYDIEEYIANVLQDKPWLENSWIGKSWNWATTNMAYGWDYMMGNDLSKYAQKPPKENTQQKQIGEEIPSGSGSGIHTIQKGNNAKFGNSDISTSGCGPAAAATVLKAYGINADLKNAAKYAEDRNYVTDTASRYTASGTTGTKASYFSDIFGANGIGTDYTDNKSAIQSAIDMGSPTVLLGQDTTNHSKSNSPFGPNPHYVVAQGKDKSGNIIVDDPELNKTTTYRQNILDNTSLGILTGGESNIKSEKSTLFTGPIQPEFIGPISPEQSAFEKDPRGSYFQWSKITPRQQIELIKKIAKENGIKETADKKEILTENNILRYFFPHVQKVQGYPLYTSEMRNKAALIKRNLEKEISASTNDVVVNDYLSKKTINKYKNKDKNPISKPDYDLEDDGLVNITNDGTTGNNEEENEESGGLLGYIGKFFNVIRDTVSNSNLSDREKKYINLVFSTDFMGNKSSNNTKGEFNDDGTAAYGNYADGSLPYKPMDSYEDFVNMSETDKSWFRLGGPKNNAQWNNELIDGNTTSDKAMIGNRSTLPNCVGWAWGRFNWIYHQLTGDKKKFVVSGNACELYDKAHTIGLHTNKTEPQPGAIMCFRSNNSDGHPGHVAIVEQVLDNGNKIVISESQWTNKTMFARYTIERNDRPGAMWTYSSGYIFQGFIYNPGVEKWIRQCEKNKDINQGTLENRCRVIWAILQRELEKLGYDNDYIVAGFMGNIWIESGRTMLASVMEGQLGINSKDAHKLRLKCKSRSTLAGNLKDIDNYTRTYISTSSGYKYDKWYLCGLGLVQWTASRAYNLLRYAYQESGGKHWTQLDTQIEYLIRKELSLGYKSILENLKNVKSAEEAAEYICLHFERPADPDATMTERQNKAKEFYSKYCKAMPSKSKMSGSGSGLVSGDSNDFNKSLTEYAKTSRNSILKEISSTKKDLRSAARYSNKPSKTPIIDFTKKSNYSKSFDNSQLAGYGSGSSKPNKYNQKQSKYSNYSIHSDPYSYGGIGSGKPSVKNNNSRSHQYQQTANSSTYNINKNNDPNYINSLIDLSKVITYLETIATNTKYNILLSKLVEILEKRAIESGTTFKTKSNKPFLVQNIDRAITSNQINIEDELSLILEKMSRIVSR